MRDRRNVKYRNYNYRRKDYTGRILIGGKSSINWAQILFVLEQVPPHILEPVVPQETIEEPGPGLNQGTEGEPPLPVICREESGNPRPC